MLILFAEQLAHMATSTHHLGKTGWNISIWFPCFLITTSMWALNRLALRTNLRLDCSTEACSEERSWPVPEGHQVVWIQNQQWNSGWISSRFRCRGLLHYQTTKRTACWCAASSGYGTATDDDAFTEWRTKNHCELFNGCVDFFYGLYSLALSLNRLNWYQRLPVAGRLFCKLPLTFNIVGIRFIL
jgi:hypothetical protein